jgi:nucleotide-binding universal stress UspA family protein
VKGVFVAGVVVGVDGSDASKVALRWAARAAADLDEPLTVVQAWSYPTLTGMPWSKGTLPAAEEVDADTDAALAELVTEELGDEPDTLVHRRVVRGPGAAALLKVVDEIRPRLLAVGTRGLGGFRGLILGSVSRQCVEYATCPVAVIDPGRGETAGTEGLRTVVVGVDGSSGAADALSWALATARDAGARLLVVHAFEPVQTELDPAVLDRLRNEREVEFLGQWCGEVPTSGVDHEFVFEDGRARDVLTSVAADESADLLVAGALGANEVKSMLGSVSSHLTQHAPVPFVVVPRGRPAT